MKKTFTRCAVALFFAISAFQNASASHIAGSDISFRHLTGNQYEVVVTVYRDCSGQAALPISITITSSCGSQTDLNRNWDAATSGGEVSQLCPSVTSTCNGGSYQGIQVYRYLDTVTVLPGCGTYSFTYGDCCRNGSISNLANPTSDGFSVTATLNSNAVIGDNSPTFSSLPVPYFCAGQSVNYSHGAVDANGDSLVYHLTQPVDDAGNTLAYNSPYTVTNPMNTSTGFHFDTLTGQMNFTPSSQGAYVVDVTVDEYRNGVLIGTTMRDIQIVVIACTNTPPVVNNALTTSNVTGAVVESPNSLGVCPGEAVSFNILAYDPDGGTQQLIVTSNIATAIPGATLTTSPVGSSAHDSVLVTFNWTPSGVDTGVRYFTIQFKDHACPIPGLQIFTYKITVLQGTSAGADKHYCPDGGPVQVNVAGGNHFSWTPTIGITSANTDSSIVFFAPDSTTTYYVQSDLAGGCKNRDTITVFKVNSFATSINTPVDTICLHSGTDLTVTPAPSTEGPFTYSWTPVNLGVQSPGAATTEVRPTTTTEYYVAVTSSAGCVIRDSFQVAVQGVGPIVSVQPGADYVCPGTNVPLNAAVSAVDCGPASDPQNPCLPGSTFAIADAGAATTAASYYTTPYTGFYENGRVQYLYKASELRALGLAAGTITDIAFNVSAKASSQPYNNFTVHMGCTSLDQLPNSYVSGLSTVLNPQSYTTSLGWNTHTLDVPYNWDGFSNLIIEVCYNNTSYTQYDNVYYTPTSFPNSVLWNDNDITAGCNITNPIQGQNRPNTRFIMCKAPLTNYTFTWTGSNGTTLPDTSNPTAQINTDVTYNVVVSDGSCQGDTSVTVHVDSAVLISAGSDTVICNNDTIQLNARLLHPAVPYCVNSYALTNITYHAITPTSPTTAGPAGDDVVSSGIAMPFPFQFFCNTVNTFYISTNGFIAFNTLPPSGCCAGQHIPDPTTPNNLVTMIWEDLNTSSGGNIDYFVSGTAPNRILVVRFRNVAYYGGGGNVNGEIHLYETTNVVEIHANGATLAGQTNTLGIENADGTVGYSPNGYNATGFTISTPVAFRFTPQTAGTALTSVHWTPSTGLTSDTILNPRAFPDSTITYVIAATFTSGCTSYDTIKVSLGTFPYTLSAVPDTICSGDTVHLIFTGNGANYTWTPDSTLSSGSVQSPYASPATTTTYHISSADSIGCRINDDITVNVRSHAPIALGGNKTICPNDSVTLTPTDTPYVSYLWSPTNAITPSITTGSQTTLSQAYSVKVNDGHCYYYSDTAVITRLDPASVVVTPAGDTAICVGDSITLSAGSNYVSYQWSDNSSTQTITVNTAGRYSYTAIDTNGCVLKSIDTANISLRQHPAANIQTDEDSICEGQTTAALYVNPVNGIIYIWNGQTTSDSFTVSTAGTYTLTASDAGCKSYDTITIANANPPTVDLGADQNICGCDTTVILSPSVNTTNNTYVWSTNDTTQTIAITQGGNYSVTVTDRNKCTADDNVTIAIRCLTTNATVTNPASGVIFLGQNATLNADTSYASVFDYRWTPSEYLNDSTSSSPQSISPQNTITYYVRVTDEEYGCVATDSVTLTVAPQADIPMPNAFTPNGDGRNDLYGPVIPPSLNGFYKIGEFRIYNRWGQQVHNSTDYWDGKVNGTLQPAGTYEYYIVIDGPDRNDPSKTVSKPLNGSFSLIH